MVMVLPQAAVLGIRMASVSDALGELSPNQDISLEDMAARGAGSASKGWEAGLPEKG